MSAKRLGTAYSGDHKKVRNMLPKINYIKEHYDAKIISMVYMASEELPPDMLTKAIAFPDMEFKRRRYVELPFRG
jgi:hypothetical protein